MLLNGVRVGAGAVVRNAIIDKNVVVPPGAEVGVDQVADEARGFMVEDGLTVLGKDQEFPGRPQITPAARAASAYALASESTVSWALRPLGFGHDPQLGAAERLVLPAEARLAAAERGAVRRDAGQGHDPGCTRSTSASSCRPPARSSSSVSSSARAVARCTTLVMPMPRERQAQPVVVAHPGRGVDRAVR